MSKFKHLLVFLLFLQNVKSWELSAKTSCDKAKLYEFNARGESGTLHFLFAADNLVRPPALIMIHSTHLDSIVEVNCTRFQTENLTEFRNSVRVNGHSTSYGMLFYQACVYMDDEDHVKVPDSVECHNFLGHNLNWTTSISGQDTPTPTALSALLRGTGHLNSDPFLSGGSIQLNFTVYAQDRKPPYPSYYDTVSGGVQVEIQMALDRLSVDNRLMRIAPVLFIFSNQSLEDTEDFAQLTASSNGPLGKLESTYLLLDKRQSGNLAGVNSDQAPGFVQFPPLSFTKPPQSAQSKVDLRLASPGSRKLINNRSKGASKYSHSVVYAFYGDQFNQIHQGSHAGYVGAREQFVNLGSPGDGFYGMTNYTAWTMVLGLGVPNLPPTSQTSHVVWIVLLLSGFVLCLVAGVICWRRRRVQSAGMFRFERMHPASVGVGLVRETGREMDGVTGEPSSNLRTALVEPSQVRKLPFSLRRPFSRRHGQHSHDATDPLLTTDPPAYDSVIRQDLT